jgi:hypothetical protein
MTYYLHRPVTKRLTRVWIISLLVTGTLFVSILGPTFVNALQAELSAPSLPSLVINEIQTGGCTGNPCVEDTKDEFIELYNPQAITQQTDGWRISYITASGTTHTVLANLHGAIAAHGYVLLGHESYYSNADLHFGSTSTGSLAKTGGHIEVTDTSGVIIDYVGWGNAVHARVTPFAALLPGTSAERTTDTSGIITFTGNDSNDFTTQNAPTPQGGDYTVVVLTPPAPAPSPQAEIPTPSAPTDTSIAIPPTPSEAAADQSKLTCEGVIISEIMPNPASTDTGHEFIELHNTSDEVVVLDGCSLQTSSSTKDFALAGISLQPDEYRAFYDSGADPTNEPFTGLTLPNTNGGTVSLLIPGKDTLAITYPADMDDDTVWSLSLNGDWALSFTSTPDEANTITPLKPCDVGQIRNLDTNRCVNEVNDSAAADTTLAASSSTTSTSAAACKQGQERNPATNRCRNIVSATATSTKVASTAAACKAGQERNPGTNRCRNIVSTAASTAKPCPTGQERNVETNRCRKITAAGSSNGTSLDGVKDVASDSSAKNKPYWLIAVIALAAAIAYGIYEWRQEILLFVSKYIRLPGKLSPLQPAAK